MGRYMRKYPRRSKEHSTRPDAHAQTHTHTRVVTHTHTIVYLHSLCTRNTGSRHTPDTGRNADNETYF